METLEKIELPPNVEDLVGHEQLTLLEAMYSRNHFGGRPAYVVKENDRVLGIAVVQTGYYPAFAKIWCLEVASDFRMRGIGRRLVEAVLDDYGATKLVAKRDAFGFYEKMGFAYVGDPHPRSNVCYMVCVPTVTTNHIK